MWNSEVKNCFAQSTGTDSCKSFHDCKGWGCKLIKVCPDKIPTTEYERAKLFSKVYSEAEKLGVLECPFFRSTTIDDVVEADQILSDIKRHFC